MYSGNVTFLSSVMLCAVLLLSAGCEEDVIGPEGDLFPYSMWGALNAIADTQFVRVFPIERTLERGDPVPLDARFTSTDLGSGEMLVWRDSVLVDTFGVVSHVFYAPFQPEWEHKYRLELERGDDAATSWVEVDIPERMTLVVEDPDTTRGGVFLPASIQGNAENIINGRVEIFVSYVIGFSPPPIQIPIFEFLRYTIPYDDFIRRNAEGWEFSVDLQRQYFPILGQISEDERFVESQGIRLLTVDFNVMVTNVDWTPPGGVFDPNVLVQPGAMENVENGFGFIGGGYPLSRSWTLPFDVVEKTDFVPNR